MRLRKMAKLGRKLRLFQKNIHDEQQGTYVIQCDEHSQQVNIKKQTHYICLGEVVNTTNAQNGQKMFLYTDGINFYVREKNEFKIKFASLEDYQSNHGIVKKVEEGVRFTIKQLDKDIEINSDDTIIWDVCWYDADNYENETDNFLKVGQYVEIRKSGYGEMFHVVLVDMPNYISQDYCMEEISFMMGNLSKE